jgi:hypothetical protein
MWRNSGVRALFLLKMLAGFAIAPEGLAAPYAAELGAATFAVGLILASDPVGSVVGAWVYPCWVPTDLKRILIGPLAVGSVFPLVLLAIRPALAISMTLIAFSGAMAAPYHMRAVALIARAVPDAVRAQVMGLTSTSLVTVQGVGIMLAGALAQVLGAGATVALAGAIEVVLAVPAAVAWNRATAAQPDAWRSGTGNLGDVSLRGRTYFSLRCSICVFRKQSVPLVVVRGIP